MKIAIKILYLFLVLLTGWVVLYVVSLSRGERGVDWIESPISNQVIPDVIYEEHEGKG